jgi:hypothetical protein
MIIMNLRALFVVPLIVILLLPLALPALTLTPVNADSQGNYESYDRDRGREKSPTVSFIKSERTQSGVKFYYKIEAGSKKLTSFMLYSTAFKKAQLLSTSEKPVEYNMKLGYISFNKNLNDGQSKTVWFELKLNYDGYKLGKIDYKLVSGSRVKEGHVTGPIWGSNYEAPHW